MSDEPAWSPTDEQARGSRLWGFMQSHGCASYPDLCQRAAREPRWFWDVLVKELGVVWSTPYREVMDASAGIPFTQWFPGGRLNAYDSAVVRFRHTDPDRLALIGETESGATRRLTYAELEDVVERAAAAVRRGRTVPMLPVAAQAADGLPQLERLVVVNCAQVDAPLRRDRDLPWEDMVGADRDRVPTEPMASDEPLMLLYTSGTTGRPKGTVHGHAGLPIKSAQDWALGMDVRPGERVMWITDMGWVMGPLLVFGSLMIGGTAVFYDGAPDHPNPARIWDVAERQGVTHLGISPTLTRVLMASGERAAPSQPIPGLRVLASTGEPWTPEAWTWLFDVVGRGRVPIMNYSGGTECGGG